MQPSPAVYTVKLPHLVLHAGVFLSIRNVSKLLFHLFRYCLWYLLSITLVETSRVAIRIVKIPQTRTFLSSRLAIMFSMPLWKGGAYSYIYEISIIFSLNSQTCSNSILKKDLLKLKPYNNSINALLYWLWIHCATHFGTV